MGEPGGRSLEAGGIARALTIFGPSLVPWPSPCCGFGQRHSVPSGEGYGGFTAISRKFRRRLTMSGRPLAIVVLAVTEDSFQDGDKRHDDDRSLHRSRLQSAGFLLPASYRSDRAPLEQKRNNFLERQAGLTEGALATRRQPHGNTEIRPRRATSSA